MYVSLVRLSSFESLVMTVFVSLILTIEIKRIGRLIRLGLRYVELRTACIGLCRPESDAVCRAGRL